MKGSEPKRGGNKPNRLFKQLAAEKKKTITASCLIALMVFMWVKVLTKGTPQSAEAATKSQEIDLDTQKENLELKISFIELPNVKGRNDVLTRDFFVINSSDEVNIVSKDDFKEVVRRVAGKLKLEAIELGENPMAFINDKLLSMGDELLVVDRGNTYECEVIEIVKNTVVVRCGEAQITLKLAQSPIPGD